MKKKMKKCKITKIVFFTVLLQIFAGFSAYGLDLVMIPVVFYEQRGSNFVQGTYSRDITRDMETRLNRYYNVRISREPLSDLRAGATDFDARRAAERYQANEVIFGTLRQNGNSLSAEIKIFSRGNEETGHIFASDSADQYDRLINTLSSQILGWYNTDADKVDALRNEVSGLRAEMASLKKDAQEEAKMQRAAARKEARENVEKDFILKVPVTVGYWSYIQQEWAETVQGTVEFSTGIQMFPELQFPEIAGMKNEVSFALRLGYRNGISGVKDNVLLNGILVNPAVGYHINPYTSNWLCFSAGAFCEIGIWQVDDFDETISFTQALTGYTLSLDYSYRLNRIFTASFGADLYGYFSTGSPFTVRAYFGTVITVFGGKK